MLWDGVVALSSLGQLELSLVYLLLLSWENLNEPILKPLLKLNKRKDFSLMVRILSQLQKSQDAVILLEVSKKLLESSLETQLQDIALSDQHSDFLVDIH